MFKWLSAAGARIRSDSAGPAAHLLQVQASHTLSSTTDPTNQAQQLAHQVSGSCRLDQLPFDL